MSPEHQPVYLLPREAERQGPGPFAEMTAQTLQILDTGQYIGPSGQIIDIAAQIENVRANTRVINASQAHVFLEQPPLEPRFQSTEIQITQETVQSAAYRFATTGHRPMVLSFASGNKPGGGVRNGHARAQGETICRYSAGLVGMEAHPEYYATTRQAKPEYTDDILYIPNVPWFRDPDGQLLDQPFVTSIIESPAPNNSSRQISQAAANRLIHTRAGVILAVSEQMGETDVILGAWGCGVFKNDPYQVAQSFETWLKNRFAHSFNSVTFAIPDQANREPFMQQFH